MMIVSKPAASSARTTSRVEAASPPRLPRLAMLRMKTLSVARQFLHADTVAQDGAAGEPAAGIDGEDADLLFRAAAARAPVASLSVLLPAPGDPVNPTMCAWPAVRVQFREDGSVSGGAPFFDQA